MDKSKWYEMMKRSDNFGKSGYSVASPSCLEDVLGLSYTGIQNVSKSGRTCLVWWPFSADEDPPDATVVHAQNFCRNVGIFGDDDEIKHGPIWFYEYEYDGPALYDDCDIPRCSDAMTTETSSTGETHNDRGRLNLRNLK